MAPWTPAAYGAELQTLLQRAPLNEIGPGTPNANMRASLKAFTFAQLVEPHTVANKSMATACCAGLWLRFDFLDQAHAITQSIDTREGSYWHAIMHRREPDFANAKYWFRRVGDHPVYKPLQVRAREVAGAEKLGADAKFLIEQDEWDPLAFVDLCEIGLDGAPPIHNLCKRVQLCEWELLFDYCYRMAAGI